MLGGVWEIQGAIMLSDTPLRSFTLKNTPYHLPVLLITSQYYPKSYQGLLRELKGASGSVSEY